MAEAKSVQFDSASPRSCAAGGHHDWRRWMRPILARAYRREMATIFELRDLAAAAERQGGGRLPRGYEFRLAAAEDLPACAALAGVPCEEYRRRWNGGDQCYAVFCNGAPVNLSWLHFGACYVYGLGLLVDAQPFECYLYNVFTDPVHRGQGLYRSTQQRLIGLLAHRGITRIRQVVAIDNGVPLAALPTLGYRLTDFVHHTCICGLKITTTRDTAGTATSRRSSWRLPAGVFRI